MGTPTFLQRLQALSIGDEIVTKVCHERARVIIMLIAPDMVRPGVIRKYAVCQYLDDKGKKEQFLCLHISDTAVSVDVLAGEDEHYLASKLGIFLVLYRAKCVTSHEDPVPVPSKIRNNLWSLDVDGTRSNFMRVPFNVPFGPGLRDTAAAFVNEVLNPDGFTTIVIVEIISERDKLYCSVDSDVLKEIYAKLNRMIYDPDETEQKATSANAPDDTVSR